MTASAHPSTTLLQLPPGWGSDQQLDTVLRELRNDSIWKDAVFPHADIKIINEDGGTITIEMVRDVLIQAQYHPYQNSQRVVIFFNLDQATLPAQQALLKFFEEPPKYVRIIATAAQLQKILPTILSRSWVVRTASGALASPAAQPLSDTISSLEKMALLSWSQIIELSETYKERDQAITMLQQLITMTTTSTNYPSKKAVECAEIMLKHLGNLQQNSNVRLTVEACFFAIKKRF